MLPLFWRRKKKMTISLDKLTNGKTVIIHIVNGPGDYPVVGSVKNQDDSWTVESWTEDGHYYDDELYNEYNLVEVRKKIKKTIWINLLEDGNWVTYSTKDEADRSPLVTIRRVACIKVDIDAREGDGL
jgi:hypothetical protein